MIMVSPGLKVTEPKLPSVILWLKAKDGMLTMQSLKGLLVDTTAQLLILMQAYGSGYGKEAPLMELKPLLSKITNTFADKGQTPQLSLPVGQRIVLIVSVLHAQSDDTKATTMNY